MSNRTVSEQLVEAWLNRHQIEWRRIRVAIAPGNRRPDYAIRVGGKWCIVEVKELSPNDEDKRLVENARAGIVEGCWVAPGKRLRPSIRSGEGQLRKFSARGFATIICLFDTTAPFHDVDFHVHAALYGDETLRFIIPVGSDTAELIGSGPGRNAMLRRDERTTVSAVAMLRHAAGSDTQIDLYHNPFAAIPIDEMLAAPLARRQISRASASPASEGPTWSDNSTVPRAAERGPYRWDRKNDPDLLNDPKGWCEREVKRVLAELRRTDG
jgi:hypothetical protein